MTAALRLPATAEAAHQAAVTEMTKSKKPKMPKVNTSDCAKGQMHDRVAQRWVKTMPGGFIA